MLQEVLDDAVFQGMEGDDHQSAVGRQSAFRSAEGMFQLFQFVVDGDAERLEDPRGRGEAVLMATADDSFQEGGQFGGGLPGFRGPSFHDCLCDGA